MEISKIKSDAAMSYQGSTTAAPARNVAETASTGDARDFKAEQPAAEYEKQDGRSAPEEGQTVSNAHLKSAVNEINRQMKNSEAIFGIHDETNRVTIKIVDKTTKEVIKEYPPEETLDMIAKVWEVAGILVDEKR